MLKKVTALIYEFSLIASVCVPNNLFQPRLIFAGNDGAYLSGEPSRRSILGWAP
jgi:hypothetical protein